MKDPGAVVSYKNGFCGINMISSFQEFSPEMYGHNARIKTDQLKALHGGCGWLQAGFVVGDPKCEEAYAILMDRFELVFQSDVRVNKNSLNKFFFAIWDMTKEKKK